jgi:hypothetical protein
VTALIFRPFAAQHRRQHPFPFPATSRTGVLDWPCVGDQDYAEGLRMVWPVRVPVVVVEHDILPGNVVAELLACLHPFCVPLYKLYPPTTCLPGPVWAHRTEDGNWIDGTEEWAPTVGLGMAKLGTARHAYTAPPLVNWSFLDTALSKHLGVQWHVHRSEVAHLHQ